MHPSAFKIAEYMRYYPFVLLYFLLAAAVLWRWRVRGAAALGAIGIVAFLVLTAVQDPRGQDYHRFLWEAGRAWLDGRDPYLVPLMIYPPYILPLFSIPALLPFDISRVFWLALIAAGTIVLIPLSQAALPLGEDGQKNRLTLGEMAIFTAMLAFSHAIYFSMDVGQPTVFIAVCLVGALYARNRGWRISAGILLALAAIKPQTMIPFLIFFLRKKDVATLVTAGLTLALLWAVSSWPADWMVRLREMHANATLLGSAGNFNDFTDKSSEAHSLLEFDRFLYCLGISSRPLVRGGAVALVLGMGGWLASEILRPGRLREGAAYSMVALFSMLFIYHHTYDTPILALPLVYAAVRAIRGQARQRPLWLTAAMSILLIWVIRPHPMQDLGLWAQKIPILSLVMPAVVMPYIVWLLLLTMACVYWAGRREAAGSASSPETVGIVEASATRA